MIINKIKFQNFRNHKNLEILNPSGLVIIIGDNATGKTNIIEGLQLLSMQESFRNPNSEELIINKAEVNTDSCNIAIYFSNNQRQLDLSLQVLDNRKSFKLNGKKKAPAELFGLLPAVLFTPDDLYLIKGPPATRRDLIDSLGCRLSKTFTNIKKDYTRVIKQKNLLLKSDFIDINILESWNQNLAKLGASLYIHRMGLYKRLLKSAVSIYHQISDGETLDSVYLSAFLDDANNNDTTINTIVDNIADNQQISSKQVENCLLTSLQQHQNAEIAVKKCLVGPHRDDINFFINKQDARRFGSQGQQRSVALALKIAEIKILKEVTGSDPLLLLDDVMSELDEQRRNQLLEIINHSTQTFITTTNLSYFDELTISRAQLLYLPTKQEGDIND
jgi:DNA replication and repair protein RecF